METNYIIEYTNLLEDNEDLSDSDDDSEVFEKIEIEGDNSLYLNENLDDFEVKKIEIIDDTSEIIYESNTDIQEIPEKKSVIKYIDREAYLKEHNIPTKKEIGDIYEIYILNYLIEVKKYKAWLWNDIPKEEFIKANILNEEDYKIYVDDARKINKNRNKNNPLQDIGIDILAKDNDDVYIFIQCKNTASAFVYSTNLTGFFMFLASHIDKKGILFYTGCLNVNIQKYMKNDGRIKFILKPFDILEHRKTCKNISNLDAVINNNLSKISPKEDSIWNNNLEKLQKYININKKLPPTNKSYDETILHKWYFKQQCLYETNSYKWTNKWAEFLNKNKIPSNYDKYNKEIDTILTKNKHDPVAVKLIMTLYNFK